MHCIKLRFLCLMNYEYLAMCIMKNRYYPFLYSCTTCTCTLIHIMISIELYTYVVSFYRSQISFDFCQIISILRLEYLRDFQQSYSLSKCSNYPNSIREILAKSQKRIQTISEEKPNSLN